jgi:hypothetical protein
MVSDQVIIGSHPDIHRSLGHQLLHIAGGKQIADHLRVSAS